MDLPSIQLETIISLAKQRGFIFPGSDIYGGLANSWDYGPLGVLLKNNIRDDWWKRFVIARRDIVGLDAAIMMNPRVWETSGHVKNFNDPLVDCKSCKGRFRADVIIEQAGEDARSLTNQEMDHVIAERGVCPNCAKREFTNVRMFNLLFETHIGSVEGEKKSVYLRGELAQSMFVDFKIIMDSMRLQVPFGIAQVGRVFRNEITPGNFTFRTLEFDLMEFEYFVKQEDWERSFEYWQEQMMAWLQGLGIDMNHLRIREHGSGELSHYSKKTIDLEYLTPFGWKEVCGLAYRTDFDLKSHSHATGRDLSVKDSETGEEYIPHVIEPTFGLTRLVLISLLNAYREETVRGETRIVLGLRPDLAPYQAAVLPLSKKKELIDVARPIANALSLHMSCDFDITQSIGRRYRRQDEIGTPYCITVDFESLTDHCVTVRERDTMKQDRIPIAEVAGYLRERVGRT